MHTPSGSHRGEYRHRYQHSTATLGSSGIREIVKLPDGEDVNEWIAVNILDFFNQTSMLYGIIVDSCTATSCPRMTAGPNFEWFWSVDSSTPASSTTSGNDRLMMCSAPVYIGYLLNGMQAELDDEEIFPSQIGKAFPPDFRQRAETIMRRLFRVFAHIYHEHYELMEQLKAVEHMNTSFKHFMLFVREFNLIADTELEPLRELIDKLI